MLDLAFQPDRNRREPVYRQLESYLRQIDDNEPPECADGIDNDGDGLSDAPDDPGCDSVDDPSERSAALPCDDGLDNDGDGGIDFDGVPPDPECVGKPYRHREAPNCGLGPELAPLLGLQAGLRRAHQRRRTEK